MSYGRMDRAKKAPANKTITTIMKQKPLRSRESKSPEASDVYMGEVSFSDVTPAGP